MGAQLGSQCVEIDASDCRERRHGSPLPEKLRYQGIDLEAARRSPLAQRRFKSFSDPGRRLADRLLGDFGIARCRRQIRVPKQT